MSDMNQEKPEAATTQEAKAEAEGFKNEVTYLFVRKTKITTLETRAHCL